MKRAIRVIIPVVLAIVILVCTAWYLFVYDKALTRDILLNTARHFDKNGNHTVATWFYNQAYNQADDNDDVAIELADQYVSDGNYTKAEYTLSKAIADGGGIDLYVALCKTYVEQDKLLDAVNMLNNITNVHIKTELEKMRPDAPKCLPDPSVTGSYYTEYITVTLSSRNGTIYANNRGEIPSVKKDLYKDGITLDGGENIIYAISVAENGLVSTTSIFGFTVGGVIEPVVFHDETMESAIREKLSVSAEKVLYTNELWTISEFEVPNGVQDLTDLKYLSFLQTLTISNSVSGGLSNLAGLASLTQLEISNTAVTADELVVIGRLPSLTKLTLSNCGLATVTGLGSIYNLIHLDLSNNAIRDITELAGLKNLTELNLQHNVVNDLTPLSAMTTLTQLDVSYNNLTTLSPVSSAVGLKKLIAGNNTIADTTGVEVLVALEELDLSHNSIASISNLGGCVALKTLDVSNNKLSDISVVSKFLKMTQLNFSYNSVASLPAFDKNCELANINGSHNSIKKLSPLKGLKYLRVVDMEYNSSISSLSDLSSCPVLMQVNVYGTKVKNASALTSQGVIVNYNPVG